MIACIDEVGGSREERNAAIYAEMMCYKSGTSEEVCQLKEVKRFAPVA